jgi:polyhydroxybutyrate depolymerase
MKRTLLILVFFLTTTLSFAQHFVNQDVYRYIMVDGHQRFFSVHFPSNFDPSQALPVVFAFHSATSDYQTTVNFFNFNGLANVNRIIMVYPNAMASTWCVPGLSSDKNAPGGAVDDVHFTSVLLDTLISDYNIDTNKVFATGMSLGGIFSLYLASKLGNRITAIAPVCASISDTLAKDFWFPRSIPVLLINGMEDPVLNYNGGMTSEFTQWNDHKDDGIMMSTEDLVNKIVKMDSCDVDPVVSDVPNTNLKDECTAVETIYTNNQHIVDFIAVVGGGHTWPGGPQYFSKELIGKVCKDFNAEERIMKFFLNVSGTKVLQE